MAMIKRPFFRPSVEVRIVWSKRGDVEGTVVMMASAARSCSFSNRLYSPYAGERSDTFV